MLLAYCTLVLANAYVSAAIGPRLAWTAALLYTSLQYQDASATTREKIIEKYHIPQELTPPQHAFALANNSSEIGIYWMRTLKQSACKFNLYRSTDLGFAVTPTCRIAEAISVNRYVDDHLQPKTTYYYRITSVLDGKESAPSFEFFETTEPAAAR